MNRVEFQKWLDQFPEDTKIEVPTAKDHSGWSGVTIEFEDFTGEEYHDFDFTDFVGNQFVKPDAPYFNAKILRLGSDNV